MAKRHQSPFNNSVFEAGTLPNLKAGKRSPNRLSKRTKTPLAKGIPRYRKHRASGQAVVTLGGRDIYLGPHGTRTSKSEYDRLVAEWLAGGRRFTSETESITVSELILTYLKWARKHYRKNGDLSRTYSHLIAHFKQLRRLYGKTPAAEFGPKRLKALRLAMLEEKRIVGKNKEEKRLSRSYINKQCGSIKRLFRWGAAEELVPARIPQSLAMLTGLQKGRTEAPEGRKVLPVDDAVIDATLARLGPVVGDMVRIQRLTGMRPAEVCLIRPVDIDRSNEVWLYQPESHKTEHHGLDRTIAIGPKGQAILMPYLLRAETDYCFAPADSERRRRRELHAERKTPMSCGNRPGTNRKRKPASSPGNRYTAVSYRRAVTRAAEAAGVPLWSPNQLRHAAATRIRAEYGLEAAQVVLGHSRADITQIYAERDLSKAIEVARRIG